MMNEWSMFGMLMKLLKSGSDTRANAKHEHLQLPACGCCDNAAAAISHHCACRVRQFRNINALTCIFIICHTNHKQVTAAANTVADIHAMLIGAKVIVQANDVCNLVTAAAAAAVVLQLTPLIKPLKQHNAALPQASVLRCQSFAARVRHKYVLA